jgi:predicted transcriptional regulator
MAKSVVITGRIDPELSAKLDALADKLDRSRAWIAAKAIERYVSEQSEFLAFVQVGEDQIDRGEFLTQDEMEEWIASLHRRADAA